MTLAAAKVIGAETRSISDTYNETAVKKLQQIDCDNSHLLHDILAAQRSRRNPGKFLCLKAKTNRMGNSFLASAIRLQNGQDYGVLMENKTTE